MEATSVIEGDVFGLYELSRDGTVLYSRSRTGNELGEPVLEAVGQDFFADIARVQNVSDLRDHFRQFVSGGGSSDTFLFDCLYENDTVQAKVFLTRAYEAGNDHAEGIVIMDIRRVGV